MTGLYNYFHLFDLLFGYFPVILNKNYFCSVLRLQKVYTFRLDM